MDVESNEVGRPAGWMRDKKISIAMLKTPMAGDGSSETEHVTLGQGMYSTQSCPNSPTVMNEYVSGVMEISAREMVVGGEIFGGLDGMDAHANTFLHAHGLSKFDSGIQRMREEDDIYSTKGAHLSGESRESHGASSQKSPEDLVPEHLKPCKSSSFCLENKSKCSKGAANTGSEYLVDSYCPNSTKNASPDQKSNECPKRRRRTLFGVSETLRQKIQSEKGVCESPKRVGSVQNQPASVKMAKDDQSKEPCAALGKRVPNPTVKQKKREKGQQDYAPLDLQTSHNMVKSKKEAAEKLGGNSPTPVQAKKKDNPVMNGQAKGKATPRSSRRQAAIVASRKVKKTLLSLESHSDEEEEESGCEGLTLNPVIQPLSNQTAQAKNAVQELNIRQTTNPVTPNVQNTVKVNKDTTDSSKAATKRKGRLGAVMEVHKISLEQQSPALKSTPQDRDAHVSLPESNMTLKKSEPKKTEGPIRVQAPKRKAAPKTSRLAKVAKDAERSPKKARTAELPKRTKTLGAIHDLTCQSSDEEDEEDEQSAGKAVTRSPADVSATLLDHAFDENQEDTRPPLQLPPDDSDDIIALEALNKAIQGAIDNHSHLTNRISAQKTNLLKEQMKHILDMAHQRCQHRISQAVSQSKSTCNSTVALLRSKVEEMTQFFEFMKNNVTAMKNTCGALQKQAESIMASSKSELEKQEAEEMKKLQSVHDSVQSAFASGLKEIFAYKQKMRPDICIPLES